MVEIHDGERPPVAAGGGGVKGLDDATPSRARTKRPVERDHSSATTVSDEIPAVLRNNPQVREYLRQCGLPQPRVDQGGPIKIAGLVFGSIRKWFEELPPGFMVYHPRNRFSLKMIDLKLKTRDHLRVRKPCYEGGSILRHPPRPTRCRSLLNVCGIFQKGFCFIKTTSRYSQL
ncbi:hypothetical protein RHGRI_030914 [Rhododendron griersonianum]|uniref:Uncharacterized protein n=1 Tax=Rhododendron griersonianum TaxID=479676 RepID=A0AAV6I993_9ERIC|nr:hypothetical protein RHGRI_030914 [Rhododendron griersonianum]